ncbi:unnamed protein product [Prorocentrum cordatum]|uniref:RING-type domain-containing protein n=1 Tax=Prorocentrum cordatum TaxID=2364126 RepID=A0ABN9T063_9DINO|nr:unnamed protein product [Polarella glacialis]
MQWTSSDKLCRVRSDKLDVETLGRRARAQHLALGRIPAASASFGREHRRASDGKVVGLGAEGKSVCLGFAVGESGIGSLRHWQAFSSEMLSAKQAKDLLAGQVSEQIENLMTFSAALASQQYFTAVRRALVDEWPQARGCAVCGEEDLPSRSLIVTPCGHCFCARCLAAPGPLRQSCKACGQPLKEGDLEPLARSLTQAKDPEQFQGSGAAGDEVEVSEGSAAERSDGGRFLKRFGTKLAVLVERLQGLRTADPTAKCILFVQFDDLKMQVGAALREGGIPTAQLKGSVSQRAAIIRDYQETTPSRRSSCCCCRSPSPPPGRTSQRRQPRDLPAPHAGRAARAGRGPGAPGHRQGAAARPEARDAPRLALRHRGHAGGGVHRAAPLAAAGVRGGEPGPGRDAEEGPMPRRGPSARRSRRPRSSAGGGTERPRAGRALQSARGVDRQLASLGPLPQPVPPSSAVIIALILAFPLQI